MQFLNDLTASISDVLYSYVLIILLVGAGIYFTVATRFAPFRMIKEQLRAVTEKAKDGKGVSSFQALMVSTASRVGTGNIIGFPPRSASAASARFSGCGSSPSREALPR